MFLRFRWAMHMIAVTWVLFAGEDVVAGGRRILAGMTRSSQC